MNTSAPATFRKKERICSKNDISRLLAEGKHGSVPGIRYMFRQNEGAECSRIMISVPKKLFKRAVKRNLLKRRIRESWRKSKNGIASEARLDILFMYSTKEVMSYEQIRQAIGQIISRLNKSEKNDGQVSQ